MDDHEEWRPIPGYQGWYEASSLGHIRSLCKSGGGRGRPRSQPYVLKSPVNLRGYRTVNLAGVKKSPHEVHKLVCLAFHGPRPSDRHTAAHRSGEKLNCRADNVRWATWEEQAADRKSHGTAIRGSMVPSAKLDESKVAEIRKLSGTMSMSAIGRLYGVKGTAIKKAITKETWAHV